MTGLKKFYIIEFEHNYAYICLLVITKNNKYDLIQNWGRHSKLLHLPIRYFCSVMCKLMDTWGIGTLLKHFSGATDIIRFSQIWLYYQTWAYSGKGVPAGYPFWPNILTCLISGIRRNIKFNIWMFWWCQWMKIFEELKKNSEDQNFSYSLFPSYPIHSYILFYFNRTYSV